MTFLKHTECVYKPVEHFLTTTLHKPRRKHNLCCKGGVFTGPLPSNKCPNVARVCLCGNVFTKSLPSSGYTRHSIFTIMKIYNFLIFKRSLSRVSSVDIAIGCGLDGRGSFRSMIKRFFCAPQCQPRLLSNGQREVLFPGLKRPVCTATSIEYRCQE
jgi:hypothetical protein